MRKIIIYIIVILLSVSITRGIYNDYKQYSAEAAIVTGEDVATLDEYAKTLKDVPSDIEGMSQYDKYLMGLDYEDNSDTDHDGLTDKEEIEKYETDPLKSSTSGDLYSDGYKVSNGMDLKEKYSSDEISFENNNCEEVLLTATVPEDLTAVIEDYTDRYSLSEFGIEEIYKGYWLYNYSGTLSIDVDEILASNELSIEDLNIWIYEGDFVAYGLSDLIPCKYSAEGNTVTLDYNFETEEAYYVYLTGKQDNSIFKNIVAFGSSYQINKSTDNTPVYLFYGSPLVKTGTIYYNGYTESEIKDIFKSFKKVNYVQLSKEKIDAKYALYKKIIPFLDFTPYEGMKTKNFSEAATLFVKALILMPNCYEYISNDEITMASARDNTNGELDSSKSYANYHTTFDIYEDELPFQNFKSEYGPQGNCTGFVYLTSYLFNNGSFPTSGEYNGVTWDISNDSENNTLTNPGLSDYKSRTFVDDNSDGNNNINTNLTDGETEFVKMIGCLYQEGNDKLPTVYDYMIDNGWSNDWELAEAMMSQLDNGKIFNVGLYLRNQTAHQIIVYDYYFNSNEELIFRVYDPSFPQNDVEGITLNCEGACYLQCKKVLRTDGTYGMTYLYYPVEGDYDYMAASCGNLMEQSSIICSDENMEVLY